MNKYISKMLEKGWDYQSVSGLVEKVLDYQITNDIDDLRGVYNRVITTNTLPSYSCYQQFNKENNCCISIQTYLTNDDNTIVIKLVYENNVESHHTLYDKYDGFTYWSYNSALSSIQRIVESLVNDKELDEGLL